MKYRFVSLFVAASVICSFFISCDWRGIAAELLTPTIRCPIRMLVDSPEFDSEEFSSEEYTFHTFNSHYCPHQLLLSSPLTGTGFSAYIMRALSSENGNSLNLRIALSEEEEEFEEGKKYSLEEKEGHESAKIMFSTDDSEYIYYATEGWIVFTEYRDNKLSGEFEFTALEKNSGNVMKVTNGIFEDLLLK